MQRDVQYNEREIRCAVRPNTQEDIVVEHVLRGMRKMMFWNRRDLRGRGHYSAKKGRKTERFPSCDYAALGPFVGVWRNEKWEKDISMRCLRKSSIT